MSLDIDLNLINDASKELSGESDRAAAIVGASLLDHLLESMLKQALVAHPTKAAEMFGGRGILGSLGAKIDMAFLLGLISEDVGSSLDRVREIRNEFAHGHEQLTFFDQSIRDRIGNFPSLKVIKHQVRLLKETGEGQKAIQEMRLDDPRRHWELVIADLSLRLSAGLKYIKQATARANVFERWIIDDDTNPPG